MNEYDRITRTRFLTSWSRTEVKIFVESCLQEAKNNCYDDDRGFSTNPSNGNLIIDIPKNFIIGMGGKQKLRLIIG